MTKSRTKSNQKLIKNKNKQITIRIANLVKFEPSINGINIEATHIAIRNNVIDGYRNAINVSHDGNGTVSGIVDIYHNTFHWRPVTAYSGDFGRLVGRSVGGWAGWFVAQLIRLAVCW